MRPPKGMTIQYDGFTDDGYVRLAVSVTPVTHASPADGNDITPCCGVTPFELPSWDRITLNPALVTCGATP